MIENIPKYKGLESREERFGRRQEKYDGRF